MKLLKIVLCYPGMDRIILNKEKDLEKYDLSKVSSMDCTFEMTVEEFEQQTGKRLGANLLAEPRS